jgi:D-alanine-D-alanine ligase
MTIWDHLKHFFRNIWEFISSPFFLKNLGVLIGLGVLLLLLTNWILKFYTHHGESLEVHNYIGMQLKDAEKTARSRSFKIVISDSIFRVDQPPNTVLEQYPAPFSRVKEDRRIYLTVTSSTAPQVPLPLLEGAYNYETYRRKLQRLGIESAIRERQFDSKLEENTILHLYHDGRKITEDDLRRGVKVPKGSTVEFVVTERLTDQVPAPDLICKRYEEASFLITATNLVIGEVYGDLENRDQAFIYQQDPEPGVMMRMGEQINIYLSSRRPRDCPEAETPSIEQEEESIEEDPFGTGE